MKSSKHIVLVVEDDRVLNQLVCTNLKMTYDVLSAHSVWEAISLINIYDIDLFILDMNLPDGTGKDVAEHIKALSVYKPFIFFTVNNLEADYVEGYSLGAVDYITKPFSMKVMLCKVNALLQSFENTKKEDSNKYNIYSAGELEIDFSRMSTKMGDREIEFSPVEYKVLKFFVENKNILLSKDRILEVLWDQNGNFIEEHTLVTHISRIRKKLQNDEQTRIRTIYGMGYMFVET